jgi:hypothetical protein
VKLAVSGLPMVIVAASAFAAASKDHDIPPSRSAAKHASAPSNAARRNKPNP